MLDSEHNYALIVAGGGGTRLWPKSRKAWPKHLLSLFGKDSMLQTTYNRALQAVGNSHIFIVTLKQYQPAITKQLPKLLPQQIIVEPEAKNTAMAMGYAAVKILKADPEAVILNLTADHLIRNLEPFLSAIETAFMAAADGKNLVAIGVEPTFPHTGLGYIRIGSQVMNGNGKKHYVFLGKGFKEKPNLAVARSFLASKEYLWNAGLYCWSGKALLEAIALHSPQIYQGLQEITKALGLKDEEKVAENVYKTAENISIDYAVSEKCKNLVVVPGNFDWDDIGDWNAIYANSEKDVNKNVVNNQEKFISVDTTNSLVEANGRMVVTIGVNDLVVVDTPDVVLVCNRYQAQDVKKIVEKLKELKRSDLL